MSQTNRLTYTKNEVTSWPIPNYWDILALILIVAMVVLVSLGAKAMLGRYHLGEVIPISISPWHLPYYALRTVLRMLIALAVSCFRLVIGLQITMQNGLLFLLLIYAAAPVLGYYR